MTAKKAIASVACAGAVALALGAFVPANAQTPPPPPGAVGHRGHREHHPELRMALRALNRAKTALQRGSHDFSGHREKALDLTNQAISEVQQAIQSDRQ
jgi:hypothetical protein